MKKFILLLLGIVICLALTTPCYADQTIVAQKVDKAPVIDGNGTDPVWGKAQAIVTHDAIANIDLTLKAVYTDTEVFFLVGFPDSDESITHKIWVWDKTLDMYKTGPDREDMFVFKWNMEPHPVDLSLKDDNDYMADIWFWKACRTNPIGYADDKYQHYSGNKLPKSRNIELTSRTGKRMFLERGGDNGTPAYKDTLYEDYKGDRMPRYTNPTPQGSRADVKAKGLWSDGRWIVEFGRALNTGNTDDIQLDTSKSYLFGVSRYEIAGRKPDPKVNQPLYGSGDVGEPLMLQFGQ